MLTDKQTTRKVLGGEHVSPTNVTLDDPYMLDLLAIFSLAKNWSTYMQPGDIRHIIQIGSAIFE